MVWEALAKRPEQLSAFLLPTPEGGLPIQETGAPEQGLTPAAVLIPVVVHADGATVLLTKRTDHLRDHPGQISFPGGRVEPTDTDALATALRETQEEIGLPVTWANPLGYLPSYHTGTGYQVTPVVALLKPGFSLSLDAFEVAEAFEVPLSFLLNPANHQRHQREIRGAQRSYHAMQYQDYFIWGATAGMIVSLAQRCGIVSPKL